jgi:hypothetical protein
VRSVVVRLDMFPDEWRMFRLLWRAWGVSGSPADRSRACSTVFAAGVKRELGFALTQPVEPVGS